MGLNTTLLIFKNIPSDKVEEKTYQIFKLLNLKIVNRIFDVEFSRKSSLIYSNQENIGVTYFEGSLIFENSFSKFMTYSKPCIIQYMSNYNPIFHILISDTTDTSSYEIYLNGSYFYKNFGFEDIDISFLDKYGFDQDEERGSCLKTNESLEPELLQFIKSFNYYDVVNQKFSVFETIDLQEHKPSPTK